MLLQPDSDVVEERGRADEVVGKRRDEEGQAGFFEEQAVGLREGLEGRRGGV
jgi:hypothetical protein